MTNEIAEAVAQLDPTLDGIPQTSPTPTYRPPVEETQPSAAPIGETVQQLEIGDVVTQEEVPGDLGVMRSTVALEALLHDAARANASSTSPINVNHRYRGHRESFKFNLAIQQLLQQVANCMLNVFTYEDAMQTSERGAYLADSDIAAMYHVREQQRFHEWLILKDSDLKWYF